MKFQINFLNNNAALIALNSDIIHDAQQTQQQLLALFKPTLTDTNCIPLLLQYMQPTLDTQPYKTRIRVQLFILLYLFYPQKLFFSCRGHKSNGILLAITQYLNLSFSNMCKYAQSLLFLYLQYPDFQQLTNTTYNIIKPQLPTTTTTTETT